MNDERPKLAVVTGAAVRLGKAIAVALAGKGYAIGLHYHHSEEAAHQTAEELEKLGVPVFPFRADLRDELAIRRMFQQIAETGLSLRVLVNSAAVMPRQDLLTITAEDWDAVMDVNLRAAWLCAVESARIMQPGSVIINISDTGARKVWTGYPVYVISKAGLEILTRLLARRLAPHIRVNAIAPGLILRGENTPVEEWERLVQRSPLGQSGSEDEICRAVTFLLESVYITGEVLVIDGGYGLI
ncbi:MAG: short chain dehydrogenase [Bellilinea sp.]|nr:MAG: short chain dehydrogenase [Bellilinea sp.]